MSLISGFSWEDKRLDLSPFKKAISGARLESPFLRFSKAFFSCVALADAGGPWEHSHLCCSSDVYAWNIDGHVPTLPTKSLG